MYENSADRCNRTGSHMAIGRSENIKFSCPVVKILAICGGTLCVKLCRINLCVPRISVHTLIPVHIETIFWLGWLLLFCFSFLEKCPQFFHLIPCAELVTHHEQQSQSQWEIIPGISIIALHFGRETLLFRQMLSCHLLDPKVQTGETNSIRLRIAFPGGLSCLMLLGPVPFSALLSRQAAFTTSAEKLAWKECRNCIKVLVRVDIVSSAALESQGIQRQWPSPQNKYRKAFLNWGRRGTGFRKSLHFFPLTPASPAFAQQCHWRSNECTSDSMLTSKWTPRGTSRLVTASFNAAPKRS